MKLLFDFFPIILFFIGFKLFGIYNATAIAMVASIIQVAAYRLRQGHYEKIHLISLAIIMVLGGATLFFHNPWFIKWKPTGIYWITALIFLGSCHIGERSLIEKMMDGNINLPKIIWKRLNYAWTLFFIVMGSANLYVAYNYSTDAWVNFKLFGCAGFTLVFVFLQALYLTKHMVEKDSDQLTAGSSFQELPPKN